MAFRRITCTNLEAREAYSHYIADRFLNTINRSVWGVIKPLRPFLKNIDVMIDLFCDDCGKHIPSETEWKCAHCDKKNDKTLRYSFLVECEKCTKAPQSYSCPHCDSINFLEQKKDKRHPARILLAPEGAASKTDTTKDKASAHLERKVELEREIEITQLSSRLERLKESAGFKEAKSTREKLEKSFSEHDAHAMGAQMIAREKRTENAKKFQDDPELLEKANESVQAWLDSQL